MKKLSAAFGLLISLAACSSEPLPPVPSSHTLPPKIVLDVQSINLADRSQQPPNSPYLTNHFTPTINDAIKQWAMDRLQAAGQTGQAIVLIKDASLTAQPLAMKDGMDSWFTRQQGVKYVARAEVSVEANGREGFATADAVATRAVTLPENPTPMERQEAYYSLLNGLMKDLGQNLDGAIQTHMSNFIITAPIMGTTSMPVNAPISSDITSQPLDNALQDSAAVPPLPQVTEPQKAPVLMPTMNAPAPSYGQPSVIPLSGPMQ